jgi:hypothetical protein
MDRAGVEVMQARAGNIVPVSMWWFKAGVAPVYRPYEQALELRSASTAAVIRLAADVRTWLPGDAVWDGSTFVPDDLAQGEFRVRVALLDPCTLSVPIESRDFH